MKRLWGAVGTATLCLGLLASGVGFFQPGLICLEDDSSAGCPATPFYTGTLMLGLVLLLTSIFFFIRAQTTKRVTAESDDPVRS